jgi:hypothetical protein
MPLSSAGKAYEHPSRNGLSSHRPANYYFIFEASLLAEVMEHCHFCASADVASFAGRYAERATSNNSSMVRFSWWTLSFFLFSNQSTEKPVELIWR